MMRPRSTLLMTALAALGPASSLLFDIAPRLAWNASASAPTGFYRIHPGRTPRLSDMIFITPPAPLATWMARRHYLPLGVPLLKHVRALPGQTICRSGATVWIEGKAVARALETDRFGRPLPVWTGCHRMRRGQIFLLNAEAPDSLDSRYFGPIGSDGLIGTATPLLTWPSRIGAGAWSRATS